MNEFILKKAAVLFCIFSLLLATKTAQGSRDTEVAQRENQATQIDSKPALKRAIPMAMGFDPTPGSSLNLTIEGEYRDLLGLRIKEQFADVNGTTFILEEDYPVWIDSSYIPTRRGLGGPVNVHFRQRKDEKRWRKYLDDVRMRRELAARNKAAKEAGEPVLDIQAEKMEMPPVWMSIPQPGKVRVFVSVYDKAGNESEVVEVEEARDWLFSGDDINKFSKQADADYYLGDDLRVDANSADLSKDLGNAALLYYQAALRRPSPDIVTSMAMSSVLRGEEPDRHIRPYLRSCRDTIRLAHAASLIPQCDWGVSSSSGIGSVPMVHLRNISFVLSLYARTLAADGHYRAALESSLTIRRLAHHIGKTNLLAYFVARGIDSITLRTIHYVLGLMPPDSHTLTWFRAQLATVRGAPESSARALENSLEFSLHNLQTNPDLLAKIRNQFAEHPLDEWRYEDLESLADEQFLARASKPYAQYLNSIVTIMNSGLPYEKKYNEIQRLEMEMDKRHRVDPIAMYMPFGGDQAVRQYSFKVRAEAYLNALEAATEIYLIQAKAGQLPTTLPEGLPQDPFSGKDFEYELTDDGFILRCRVRDIEASPKKIRKSGQPPEIISDKFQQYEFKVKNED